MSEEREWVIPAAVNIGELLEYSQPQGVLGCSGSAAMSNFVHLIDQDEWVLHNYVFEGLDDPTQKGTTSTLTLIVSNCVMVKTLFFPGYLISKWLAGYQRGIVGVTGTKVSLCCLQCIS